MTISYTGDVANASGFGCFNKILLKWKGSVYKLIYKELLAYILIYLIINIFYRELLVKKSQEKDDVEWRQSRELFESLVTYCHDKLSSIPLTFVLGFYVSLIVSRWWSQYTLLPWPDSMAILVVTFLTGKEERQRLMRRNIIRYILLSYCMATRAVSFRVKKRFPDLQHLVDAGLMREDEYKVLVNLDGKVHANKWFLPLVWASDICARALSEGSIRPQTVRALIAEICNIREKLTGIMNHDWVCVPLVYTQVVTLAVYSYFVAAIIGGQWINPESPAAYEAAYGLAVGEVGKGGARLDLFYPFFLTIQFAFFFGWLKVAETLINPFGEDDDDFELNRLIDRHCQVGYLIVEHDETPELLQDKYWDMTIPQDIPYTVAAEKYKAEEFVGSAEATLQIKESDKVYGDVYAAYNQGKGPASRGLQREKCDVSDVYDIEYGDYEDIGTPIPQKVNWLSRQMKQINHSIRSNKSISSSSTYIYGGAGLIKKPIHKSQLSLYEKLSRRLSIFDEKHIGSRGDMKTRKSNRQRSVSDTKSVRSEDFGFENKSFEKEETELEEKEKIDDDFNLILDKKLLETITENQNSPYSTQASHNPSRRMSAQSIFTELPRRGSMPKEPFNGPVIEMFHENEDCEEETENIPDSCTGSSESGVESMGEIDQSEQADKRESSGLADLAETEEENEKEEEPSTSNDNYQRSDIDSPFEVLKTVYV